jgi:hypothetical protein
MLYTEEEENDDDALHISLKNAVSNNKAIQLVFSTGKESPCLVELGQRAREPESQRAAMHGGHGRQTKNMQPQLLGNQILTMPNAAYRSATVSSSPAHKT